VGSSLFRSMLMSQAARLSGLRVTWWPTAQLKPTPARMVMTTMNASPSEHLPSEQIMKAGWRGSVP